MRIRSTTVDGHQFTRVRRGYDTAEVDAVMARIADTLRDYEDQADDLESRIAAAETAAKVARQVPSNPDDATEAARGHAGDIIRQAEDEATRRKAEIAALLEAARREAEELRLETEDARDRVETDRAAIETDRNAALAEADEIRKAAHADAHAIKLAATREAQALLTAALAEARALRSDAASDAAELRAQLMAEADETLAAQRTAIETAQTQAAGRAEHTAAVLAAAEQERRRLEERLATLRNAVEGIEEQMHSLAGEIAAGATAIGNLTGGAPIAPEPAPDPQIDLPIESVPSVPGPVSALPVSGFQAPDERAPLAIADPTATIVVDGDDDHGGIAADTDTSTHHHAYADPDGSGRPLAERATVVPEDVTAIPVPDRHGPDRTVYQRAGRNLRARLRREGQDPTQRGR
jgi:DivIVA domain-containing protein